VTALDLGDIQGDILRAYGNDYKKTSYVFITVDDAAAGRGWLAGLVDGVTTAEPWNGEKPVCHTNVAFTYSGLQALGVPPATLESFSSEFRSGMAGRAAVLGDSGPSDPSGWDDGLGSGRAHVLVTLNALGDAELAGALRDLLGAIEGNAGLSVVYEQHTGLFGHEREHFGFADGFAQPAIEGSSEDRTRGGGVPEKDGGWRALAPGEFILGYPDEDTRVDPERRLPSAPNDPLGRNSTYMVWRKLHQDVALFRRTMDGAAVHWAGDAEQLAAKVVGRWRDGTPLELSPDAPDPALVRDTTRVNDFRYADADGRGLRCPIGSHIRRSNPRDSLGFDGLLTFRHRIIRRGMPYGDPLPAAATEDDGAERGLVFVAFNASISRQFEGIQAQWLNDGNIFHLGHDKDYLLGDSATTAKMTVQGEPPFFISPQPSFVTTRGGEYLFVPGLTGLAAIADGVA
jgi:Dyp-type peroxidase family